MKSRDSMRCCNRLRLSGSDPTGSPPQTNPETRKGRGVKAEGRYEAGSQNSSPELLRISRLRVQGREVLIDINKQ